MRGTDDTHIDRNFLPATQAFNRALLQKSQQLGLQRDRKVPDFIEHQGTAIGGLDLAQRHLGGAGKGTLLVAKQFALEQILGNSRAIDGHELACPAP